MTSPTTDRRLGLVGNTAYKAPVTVIATSNITLSGEQTIDGVGVLAINAAGKPDRVLCVAQTSSVNNGIYDVSTGAWTRSVDANGNYDIVKGSQVIVTQGSAANQIWECTGTDPITIGTTALTWSQSLSAGFLSTLAASGGSALVGFLPSGTGAVARTAQAKMRDVVSVKDYGAVGDGTTDDTAAIQLTFRSAVANGFKRVVFPDGIYKVSSAITIAPYYSVSLDTTLIASNGADFEIDFGRAHIKSTAAAAASTFIFTSTDYPETRYSLSVHGGSFSCANAIEDVFKFTGSQMWMCQFWGMSFNNGTPVNIFKFSIDSATYEPGTFVFRDMVAKANNFINIDDGGGLKFVDNFTIDNIYFFGQSASGGVVYLDTSCGMQSSRLNKIIHVGVGTIINSAAGSGYLSYCSLEDLYSETTTNNATLLNCLLSNCSVEDCRASVNDSSTQTVSWINGVIVDSNFHNLHVTDVTLTGAKPYDSETTTGANYYPVLAFGGASTGNTVSGYNRGEFRNGVEARTGAIRAAPGVVDVKLLTAHTYDATPLEAVAYTQIGNTVPAVSYLGKNFMLEVEASGVAYTAGDKTIALQVKVGGDTLTIGAAISVAVNVWKIKGRLYFRYISGTTWNVVCGYSESWVGTTQTVGTRIGTADVGAVAVDGADAISFGLDISVRVSGSVLITDGTMKLVERFGLFDTAV